MTSISSTLASIFSTASSTHAVSKTSSELAEVTELAALLQGQQGSSSYGPPYTISLSPAAQDTLSGASATTATTNSASQIYGNNQPKPLQLTDAQKATVQSIFDKYKDAPLNADTLDAIDADLHKAGVAPDQLAQAASGSASAAAPTFGDLLASLLQNATGPASAADARTPLTDDQKKTVQAILDTYKDAPKTPETFKQIASDLKAAGINPKQVFHHHGGGHHKAQDTASTDDDGTVATDSIFSSATTATDGTTTSSSSAPGDIVSILEQILQAVRAPNTPQTAAATVTQSTLLNPATTANG